MHTSRWNSAKQINEESLWHTTDHVVTGVKTTDFHRTLLHTNATLLPHIIKEIGLCPSLVFRAVITTMNSLFCKTEHELTLPCVPLTCSLWIGAVG